MHGFRSEFESPSPYHEQPGVLAAQGPHEEGETLMGDLSSMDELARLTAERARSSGYGLDVKQHFPCPFCAHPDWLVVRIIDFARGHQPPECPSCGRTSRLVFTVLPGGGQEMRLVQVGGPDAPDWMPEPPERVA